MAEMLTPAAPGMEPCGGRGLAGFSHNPLNTGVNRHFGDFYGREPWVLQNSRNFSILPCCKFFHKRQKQQAFRYRSRKFHLSPSESANVRVEDFCRSV